ncbi:hypothetical protein F5883DRAFT_40013 [Diaporthe sp. PMI_573]|nr:hypothetical protein F5883DRAFT_40013 [Diaporthaceae sp. PMI_573]
MAFSDLPASDTASTTTIEYPVEEEFEFMKAQQETTSLEVLISDHHANLLERRPSIFFKHPQGFLAMRVEGGKDLEWLRLKIPTGRFWATRSSALVDVCRLNFEDGHAKVILRDGVIRFGLARSDDSDGTTLENLNDELLSVKMVESGKQIEEGIGLRESARVKP